MKSKVLMPLLLLAVLGVPVRVMAHALETNYVLEEVNKVQFTAVFSTGEPHKKAKVKIYSPDNLTEPVMETETDENGQFTFDTSEKCRENGKLALANRVIKIF
ncbi:transthyretin-like family protein [Acaryochloris marina]|uniref:transthyretin-like family protein n=1 Tax=Acaryochloris marina TaxID=155978 RepID=UPI0021C309AF|nr:transthyretin-like family protein [Acaryochloris marina]